MKLSDLFTSLSYSELSNLAIGGEGSGTIPAAHEARLTNLVNKALLALYGRFIILEKEVVVAAQDSMTLYPLKRENALTDTTPNKVKYIRDSLSDPFLEDVIKILTVYDDAGHEIELNDPDEDPAIYNPAPDIVQITAPVVGDAYFFFYQARHPLLLPGDLTQDILLPDVLEPALSARVAYHVFSPMNGQEHAAKAAEYLQLYEMLCTAVESKDLISTSGRSDNSKFHDRGFL